MEPRLTSANTIGIPSIGFGTYQLSPGQAEVSVKEALKTGYRHIDSAEGYQNEEATGSAIQSSGIKREELFLTTKLFPGNKQWGMPEKTYGEIIETLKRQLAHLKVDYVDLYLIHAPLAESRLEQWRALVELKKMGLTRHIGVSNYSEELINEIQTAGLPLPEANQIEFHPLCIRPQLTEFMIENGITPIAYSSLAPLSSWRMEEGQGGEVLSELKTDSQRVIKEIASKLKVSDANVLLRWGIQHGYAVLTKSSRTDRIRENFQVFSFEIPDGDMKQLDALNMDQPFAWAANGMNPMEAAPAIR